MKQQTDLPMWPYRKFWMENYSKGHKIFWHSEHKHNRKSLPVSGGDSNRNTLLQSHIPHGSDCRTARTLIWLRDQSSQHPILFSLSNSMPIYTLLQRHRFVFPACSWRFAEYIHEMQTVFWKKVMSILDYCKGSTMYKTGFHLKKGRFTLKQTPPVGLFHVKGQHPVSIFG